MPKECTNGITYTVKRGDTLYEIARRFGVTVDQILAANPEITNPDVISIGQTICIPVEEPGPGTCPGLRYTIRAGDTFYSLARRFNVTVNDIIAANPGVDPENLQIGQVICIPGIPPFTRPTCRVLNPTDLVPASKSFIFIEPDTNSVLAGVTNVPDPSELPDGEIYKIWVRRRGTEVYAVGDLEEVIPDYYIGRVVADFPLSRADVVLISSEKAENVTAPAGIGVAEGTL